MGKLEWKASRILEAELLRNPNLAKRTDALELLFHAGPLATPSDQVIERGKRLAEEGYGAFDALYLAHAEELQVDALLTTDDRFMRKAARGIGRPAIRVVNPVDWLEEVRTWLQKRQ